MNRYLSAVLASLMALSWTPAFGADYLDYSYHEKKRGLGGLIWNKEVRFCEDAGILNRIERDFRYQVRHVPHLPDVEIVDFLGIYEDRYYPASEDNMIARRYCGATVHLSDGHRRQLFYLIEDEMGFASLGDGVEFCVQGFDRWHVYNGYCRLLD